MGMTEKQKRFADEYLIDLNGTRAYKENSFNFLKNPHLIVIESLAVLIGDYGIYRKQAAILLLKVTLSEKFFKFLMEDENLYPISRADQRIRAWRKEIIKRGFCEKCGSVENLEAHHIIKWADYPQGRISLGNGECLCLKCHMKEHRFDQSFHMMRGKLNAKANP
ncbi:MAG: HNH endonuclease [Eubacterium sp.]